MSLRAISPSPRAIMAQQFNIYDKTCVKKVEKYFVGYLKSLGGQQNVSVYKIGHNYIV